MATMREPFTFTSSDQLHQIPGMLMIPEGKVRGVCQFAHGMCDYGARYEELCLYLAAHGYVAAYHDHLGHGDAVKDSSEYGYFAEKDGVTYVVDDVDKVFEWLDKRYHGYKHFVMGHSMGSFITRIYIARYAGKADGAVLLGTGRNAAAGLGVRLANTVIHRKGGDYRSKFLNNQAFKRYSERLENTKSLWGWLSREPLSEQQFIEDPKRSFTFTAAGFRDLFQLVYQCNHKETMAKIPKDMPLLFLSGLEDPLGQYGRGVRQITDDLCSAGFTDVRLLLYPGARHELCHETNREEVFADIVAWLDARMPPL